MIAKYQALPSLLGAFLQLCEVQRGRGSSVLDETLLLGLSLLAATWAKQR